METEFTALKAFIADKVLPNPVPPYIEGFVPHEGDPHKSAAAVIEANCLFEEPFNFYGGFIMQAIQKKKEIMKDAVVRKLLAKIAALERDIELRDEERQAVNNVATLNFELAQKDADRIKEQS
mmetsp:Transcript_28802/g.38414  ORF Transcript_28802/g.38414 Transcript_28802/m.38414 type:complete len:123 (+) Transcript_28802:661-1029(+)|eukprot:CAMPEP_0185574518 /NCGR_PEP_ID=MMETSP0434-20130131/5973_1 /TAXON_ID=626734 ORGANISM="Favella taraikaensis, Strain Fe Narragansett Bay" /NCGR_SAMPLE_ID=MMETSP0434 /ASSEMBLY_ACC=CAM_ASM_000379 /LENGTH=122 /DNA_ID=CAMNT_0028191125 /DNA_START=655 /DNA_END=1023 /DNA_ORIENTATION=+